TTGRSLPDLPGPTDKSVQCSSCLAKTSLPGFGRRCLRASNVLLLATSCDFLQGTFEKIYFQCLVGQHWLEPSHLVLKFFFPGFDRCSLISGRWIKLISPGVHQLALQPQFLRQLRDVVAPLHPLDHHPPKLHRMSPHSLSSHFAAPFFLPSVSKSSVSIQGFTPSIRVNLRAKSWRLADAYTRPLSLPRMDRYEVLIAGAGPAGSFAAERLAAGGVQVALFDGRPDGEPKACGGGVTAKALKAWPHLLKAVGRTVNDLEMFAPSGRGLRLKLDEPFAIYSRRAFDSYLRECARAAGATVFKEKISNQRISKTDNGWILKGANGAEWTGKFLVGADGANSAIAKRLAGPLPASEMEVAFGYRTPLPGDAETPTVVAFLPG